MITCFSVNLLCILLAFFAKDHRFKLCFPIAFLLLTIFYGIRYDFGNDYWGYYEMFQECSHLDFDGEIEPGWQLLMYCCQPIGFFGFIFLLTCLDNLLVYKIIKRNVKRQWWWFAMYVFLFTFNFFFLGLSMMRQYFAMLICMVAASHYLSRGKFIKYLLLIVIAGSIHYSALIMLLCTFFTFLRPNIKNILIMLSFMALFLMMTISTDSISNSLQQILQLELLEAYSGYSDWEEGTKSPFKIAFDAIMLFLLMRSYPNDKIRQVFYWIFLVSFLILPFSYALVILVRIMLYFSIFSILCYPNLFQYYRKKWFFLPLTFVYLLYTFRLTINTYTGETYGAFYKVYKSIFMAPYWL